MFRVGVIGCRGIGNRHANGAEGLPNVEVVAACDLVEEQLNSFEEQFKPTNPRLVMYTNYKEMLDTAKLDIVTVATGDNAHANMVVAAAEAGAKGIFCEKPLATTLEEADRMVAATEKSKTLLSVDHTRHWMPLWHRCHELVAEGALGEVKDVAYVHHGARSMLFRNGTHTLDTIRWFAGSKPEWLVGELEDGYEDYSEYRGDGGHDPAAEPSANAYIHFANSVRGFYLGEKQASGRSHFTVTGTLGALVIEEHANPNDTVSFIEREGGREPVKAPEWPYEGIETGFHELVQVLDGSGQLSCPGRDALTVVEMLLACLKSQQEGNSKVTWPLVR